MTSGASAVKNALDLYGAKRIAVLTPYQQVIDTQVERYFDDLGYDLVRMKGLRVQASTGAAAIRTTSSARSYASWTGPDVDAIVQAGTNLSVTLLAEELERELGKPVIPINVACIWHAFRAVGIEDRIRLRFPLPRALTRVSGRNATCTAVPTGYKLPPT